MRWEHAGVGIGTAVAGTGVYLGEWSGAAKREYAANEGYREDQIKLETLLKDRDNAAFLGDRDASVEYHAQYIDLLGVARQELNTEWLDDYGMPIFLAGVWMAIISILLLARRARS